MTKTAKMIIVGALMLAITPLFPASAKKSTSSNGIKLKNAVITNIDYSAKIITATNNNTAYTIDASAATIKRRYGATASFTEIITGDSIRVWGSQTGTNIVARKIRDNSIQKWKASFTGTITAVDSATYTDSAGASYQQFTLQSAHRGIQTVRVYAATRIKYKGTSKTFSDIVVGEKITAKGIWNSTSSIVYDTNWVKIRQLAVED